MYERGGKKMTTAVIKSGQVWRSKNKEDKSKVAIIAVSWDNVFVSGTVDEVDPEWTKEYLLKEYEIDSNYY